MEVKLGFSFASLVTQGRINIPIFDTVKSWLKTENLPQLTDEQTALFLIPCDNQEERTKATIKSYYKIRRETSEIFTNRCVKSERLQKQLKVGTYAILPERTENNCAVIVLKLQDADYRKFDFEAHIKIICMMLDAIPYNNPPTGLISIMDMQGNSLMHLTKVKLSLAKTFTEYVQESIPLKLKSVHILNGGYVASALFNVFKPFIKKEVKDMIHFHSSTSFQDTCLKKEFLPEEYGGDLAAVLVHHDNTADKLAEMQSYFDAEEKQRSAFVKNLNK